MNHNDQTAERLKLAASLLEEMASRLSLAANQDVPDWDELFYDLREAGDSGAGISRTIVKAGKCRHWIELPDRVLGLSGDLLLLRDQIDNYHWYGLFVHVKRTGEVEVKYDYNQDCVDSFDEDEENQIPF